MMAAMINCSALEARPEQQKQKQKQNQKLSVKQNQTFLAQIRDYD